MQRFQNRSIEFRMVEIQRANQSLNLVAVSIASFANLYSEYFQNGPFPLRHFGGFSHVTAQLDHVRTVERCAEPSNDQHRRCEAFDRSFHRTPVECRYICKQSSKIMKQISFDLNKTNCDSTHFSPSVVRYESSDENLDFGILN